MRYFDPLVILLVTVGGILGKPHVVYLHNNQQPSLLYINSAIGGTTVTNARDSSSNIIELILYPANQEDNQPRKATAIIGYGSVNGNITLIQANPPIGPTVISGNLTGLAPGKHGFHIHELGDLSDGCKSSQGHYNPYKKNHGSPKLRERHVGDLGNILADGNGTAIVDITDDLISLVGPRSVIGRALVIHAGEDDLGEGGHEFSSTTGNAGGRVGCGVIGFA